MKAHRINTHLFALYYHDSSTYASQDHLAITDRDLVHRMNRVLRLASGDACILFDRTSWIEMVITGGTRTTMTGTITAKHAIQPWHPKITFFLPLLKRESLSTAIYDLVQAGVQEIQLIITQKVHHTFGGAKELERLKRIIIAAAEQSKNFAFPQLQEPIPWSQVPVLLQNTTSYMGDPSGTPIFTYRNNERMRDDAYSLIVGPEGDFTPEEYAQLKEARVVPISLTPTILKSETAAFYLAALFRSFFV